MAAAPRLTARPLVAVGATVLVAATPMMGKLLATIVAGLVYIVLVIVDIVMKYVFQSRRPLKQLTNKLLPTARRTRRRLLVDLLDLLRQNQSLSSKFALCSPCARSPTWRLGALVS